MENIFQKTEIGMELADRVYVLQAKSILHNKAVEWIDVVDGNKEKSRFFIETLKQEFDIFFNEYSKEIIFEVVFEPL